MAKPFNYSVNMVAFAFAALACVSTLLSPLVGMLDDAMGNKIGMLLMSFGTMAVGCGSVLMAPSAWISSILPLDLDKTGLWSGLIVLGIGVAFASSPGYTAILQHATHTKEASRAEAMSVIYGSIASL